MLSCVAIIFDHEVIRLQIDEKQVVMNSVENQKVVKLAL